jgi:hypothetical protein
MKKILKKIDKLYAGVVLAIAATILLIGGLETIRVLEFPNSNIEFLPADNTVFAVEWVDEQAKELIDLVGIANARAIVMMDEQILDADLAAKVRRTDSRSKAYARINIDNESHNLLVYQSINTEGLVSPYNGWHILTQNQKTYITDSRKVIELLSKPYTKVGDLPEYRDSNSNVPKLTFAQVYFNHSMPLQADSENQYINRLISLRSLLGVTTASISIDSDGIYISTYTNPANQEETKFPFTPKKYTASLMNHLPTGADAIFGGIDLTSRMMMWLNPILGVSESTSLNNVLVSLNLDMDSFNLFKQILEGEYALGLYEDQPLIVIEKQNEETLNLLLEELAKVAAGMNPKLISYTLEDGQVARQLVPNEQITYELDEDIYTFDLKDADKELYLVNRDAIFITMSEEILEVINDSYNPFSATQEYQDEFTKLLSVSDEVLFTTSQEVSDQFGTNLEDTPSVTSGFNYFDDGIQTVHYLVW